MTTDQLHTSYLEAQERERAAWQADKDNPHCNHRHHYSPRYWHAYQQMILAYRLWRASVERVEVVG